MSNAISTRQIDIELGGVTLNVTFEALNLITLSKMTGGSPVDFFESIVGKIGSVRNDDDVRRASVGRRASDPAKVIPLLIAGIAHVPEFNGVDTDTLERRICALIDKEARTHKAGIIGVFATLAGKMIPVFSNSLIPPAFISADEEKDGGGARPLPEESSSTGTS